MKKEFIFTSAVAIISVLIQVIGAKNYDIIQLDKGITICKIIGFGGINLWAIATWFGLLYNKEVSCYSVKAKFISFLIILISFGFTIVTIFWYLQAYQYSHLLNFWYGVIDLLCVLAFFLILNLLSKITMGRDILGGTHKRAIDILIAMGEITPEIAEKVLRIQRGEEIPVPQKEERVLRLDDTIDIPIMNTTEIAAEATLKDVGWKNEILWIAPSNLEQGEPNQIIKAITTIADIHRAKDNCLVFDFTFVHNGNLDVVNAYRYGFYQVIQQNHIDIKLLFDRRYRFLLELWEALELKKTKTRNQKTKIIVRDIQAKPMDLIYKRLEWTQDEKTKKY